MSKVFVDCSSSMMLIVPLKRPTDKGRTANLGPKPIISWHFPSGPRSEMRQTEDCIKRLKYSVDEIKGITCHEKALLSS